MQNITFYEDISVLKRAWKSEVKTSILLENLYKAGNQNDSNRQAPILPDRFK